MVSMGATVSKTVLYTCRECDDFEIEKSFTGREGSEGEAEFEQSGWSEDCPACGGVVDEIHT